MKPLKLRGSALRPPQAYRIICCMLTWALPCLGCQHSVTNHFWVTLWAGMSVAPV